MPVLKNSLVPRLPNGIDEACESNSVACRAKGSSFPMAYSHLHFEQYLGSLQLHTVHDL